MTENVSDDVHVMRTPLSRSIRDALVIGGILTVKQIRATNDDILLRARGIGPSSLANIRQIAPFDPSLSKEDVTERGLKTVCSKIASVYGMRVDRFYEVQRELMEAGLLPKRKGQGPGSGVEFTIENLAIVLALGFAKSIPIQISSMADAALNYATKRARK